MLVALLLAWALVAQAADDGGTVAELRDTPPRLYGWQLGDRFEREVVLELHAPYRLDQASLPAAGRLTHWLEIAAPRIEASESAGRRRYRITLSYQLMNISPEYPDIALPELLLRFDDGRDQRQVLVPGARLRVGTLTDFDPADLGPLTLRPAQAPPQLALPSTRLALAGGVLTAALIGLAWLRWGVGAGKRRRPFLALDRQLAAREAGPWATAEYLEILRAVHRAFDTTAGHTVFEITLERFFSEHGAYAALEREIHAFFRHSAAQFFRAGDASPAYPPAELRRLVAACARLERAGA